MDDFAVKRLALSRFVRKAGMRGPDEARRTTRSMKSDSMHGVFDRRIVPRPTQEDAVCTDHDCSVLPPHGVSCVTTVGSFSVTSKL